VRFGFSNRGGEMVAMVVAVGDDADFHRA
jgi:hypothetical protein